MAMLWEVPRADQHQMDQREASRQAGSKGEFFSSRMLGVSIVWYSLHANLGKLIIHWNYPLPSNSHHQDYYIFNRESL